MLGGTRRQRPRATAPTAARSSSRPGAFGGVNAINAVGARGLRRRASCRPSRRDVAGRGAQGAGRRGPHLRDHDGQGRRRLRPVPRHALAGLRRRRGARPPSTNEAVAETRGQVVTYDGHAGRHVLLLHLRRADRERREHAARHRAASRGCGPSTIRTTTSRPSTAGADPHDAARPARKLRGLVKGSLPRHRVIRRGASPRIIAADVVGSRGHHAVDGATLRARFGLFDTWAYFTSISGAARRRRRPPGTGGSGGAHDARRRAFASHGRAHPRARRDGRRGAPGARSRISARRAAAAAAAARAAAAWTDGTARAGAARTGSRRATAPGRTASCSAAPPGHAVTLLRRVDPHEGLGDADGLRRRPRARR